MAHAFETIAEGIVNCMATRHGERPCPFCGHTYIHDEDCLYLAVVSVLGQEQEGGLQVAMDHIEAAFQALNQDVWRPRDDRDTIYAVQHNLTTLIRALEEVT